MIPQTDIQTYLDQLKAKLGVFGVVIRKRDKNLDERAALDIAPILRENYLKDLKPEDYCSVRTQTGMFLTAWITTSSA